MARDPISTGSDTAKGIASSAAVAAQATLASADSIMNASKNFGDTIHSIQKRHDDRQAFLKEMKMKEREHELKSKQLEAQTMATEYEISRKNSMLGAEIEALLAQAKRDRNQGNYYYRQAELAKLGYNTGNYDFENIKAQDKILKGMGTDFSDPSKPKTPQELKVLKDAGLLPDSNTPNNVAANGGNNPPPAGY